MAKRFIILLIAYLSTYTLGLCIHEINFNAPQNIIITTFIDEDDGILGGGSGVSLREAINYSQAGAIIELSFPFFIITRVSADSAEAYTSSTGDFDIQHDLTIRGNNGMINGNWVDRIFHVQSGVRFELTDVTLINGRAPDGPEDGSLTDGADGGAILNYGNLILRNVEIFNCAAGNGSHGPDGDRTEMTVSVAGKNGGNGGALSNYGSANLFQCHMYETWAGEGGVGGDGAFNDINLLDGSNGGRGGHGGGIFNNGMLVIKECELNLMQAGEGGAAGEAATNDIPFARGEGGSGGIAGNGGAIYSNGIIQAELNIIHSNTAGKGGKSRFLQDGPNGGNGGGVWLNDNYTVLNNLFYDNKNGDGGNGGFGLEMFIIGTRGGDGGKGGAIFISGGNGTLNANTIANNLNGEKGLGGDAGIFEGIDGQAGMAAGVYISSDTSNWANGIIWDEFEVADDAIVFLQNSNIRNSGGSTNWNNTFGINLGGNLDISPGFVDADDRNYRLLENAASRNAGLNSALATLIDLDGRERIIENAVDQGAYEYILNVPCGEFQAIVLDDNPIQSGNYRAIDYISLGGTINNSSLGPVNVFSENRVDIKAGFQVVPQGTLTVVIQDPCEE